ncbi:MAG: GTPase Era [Paludibacteraceae bacterium]|nr:GTPase Era [Paludibacteraceae bacterium]
MHRSGFVNIVGNPNVGKSTLMNALVGERLSIITSKAQTTRHRIMGIVNGEDFQIVYSDTPGVLKPNYKLQEDMLEFSRSALVDADILLYVTDVQDSADRNADFLEKVKLNKAHILLVINKIDLTTQETLESLVDFWHKQIPAAEIFPISALENFGTDMLLKRIIELLPPSPPFFDKDQLTDKPEKFFVTEIIREKILRHYDKEIPYSVEVEVVSFKDESERQDNEQPEEASRDKHKSGLIRIEAVIYVERESQKGIIIGKQGKALKRIGTEAREDMEAFFQKRIFLQLFVKVDKDWRQKSSRLKHYGYEMN